MLAVDSVECTFRDSANFAISKLCGLRSVIEWLGVDEEIEETAAAAAALYSSVFGVRSTECDCTLKEANH